jgi:hypothetical protein
MSKFTVELERAMKAAYKGQSRENTMVILLDEIDTLREKIKVLEAKLLKEKKSK